MANMKADFTALLVWKRNPNLLEVLHCVFFQAKIVSSGRYSGHLVTTAFEEGSDHLNHAIAFGKISLDYILNHALSGFVIDAGFVPTVKVTCGNRCISCMYVHILELLI